MTRHARRGREQGRKRDEEGNHHPKHGDKPGSEYQTGRFEEGASGLAQAGREPVEIGVADPLDVKHQKLGGLVAVQGEQAGFQGGELVGGGLEQEQGLRGGLDLPSQW